MKSRAKLTLVSNDQPTFYGKSRFRKPRNGDVRRREHLLPDEVVSLIDMAKGVGRHGERDATLILIAYRHGLRVSELIALKWEQVDFKQGVLHVHRVKSGTPATHPLQAPTLRALRKLKRNYPGSSYVFLSERGSPLSADAVRKIIQRAGIRAGLGDHVHPHQLRHGCGYYLAAKGIDTRAIQAYLGHRSIQHTVRYTELAPDRFKNFWAD